MTKAKPERRKPFDRRNGSSDRLEDLAKSLVVKCVPDALLKCRCGSTLKTKLDWQLHSCTPLHREGKPQRSRLENRWA